MYVYRKSSCKKIYNKYTESLLLLLDIQKVCNLYGLKLEIEVAWKLLKMNI